MSGSRYNRYTQEAMLVLTAARDRAMGAGRDECEPKDLIAALFSDPWIAPEGYTRLPPDAKLRLSRGLREILNQAERYCSSGVQPLDLLQATARVCREELARYCGRSAGGEPESQKAVLKGADLADTLKSSVIGQDYAIRAVAETIRLRSLGLDLNPKRPVGVFLFSGPTGVGKTELATALARGLTGRHDRLLRLDCSEFAEDHQIARLIGAPPSYTGYGTPSPLEEFLKGGTEGVVLLDEFEKANPTLHRLFLQVFDAGRLTDSKGKAFDLSGMVFIATTNILAPKDREPIGFGGPRSDQSESGLPMGEFVRVFPMELLNRFDEIVMFKPLDRESVRRILREHLLARANEQAGKRYGVRIELSEQAEEFLINEGHSEELGARNLQRVFSRSVLMGVASLLMQLNRPRGLLFADVQEGEIVIQPSIQHAA